MHAAVLDKETLAKLKPVLEKIKPMPAVFDQYYVKRLNGTRERAETKTRSGWKLEELMLDIRLDSRDGEPGGDDLVQVDEVFWSRQRCTELIEGIQKGSTRREACANPQRFAVTAALSEGDRLQMAPALTVQMCGDDQLSKKARRSAGLQDRAKTFTKDGAGTRRSGAP